MRSLGSVEYRNASRFVTGTLYRWISSPVVYNHYILIYIIYKIKTYIYILRNLKSFLNLDSRDFLNFSLILFSLLIIVIIINFDIYYNSSISNSNLKRAIFKGPFLKTSPFSELSLFLFLLLLLRKLFITRIIYIINS